MTFSQCISSSKLWTYLFLIIIWGRTLIGSVRGVLLRLPFISQFTDQIEIAIYIVPLVFSLPYIFKKLRASDYLFYIIGVLCFFISYLNTLNISALDEYGPTFVFITLPYFFIGRLINFEVLRKPFILISEVCIIVAIFYNLFFIHSGSSNADVVFDNMGASYSILPHVLLVLAATFKSPNLLRIVLSVFGIFLCLSFGSRGPLVCISSFTVLYILFLSKHKYRVLFISVTVFASFIAYFFIEPILNVLSLYLNNLNMSTRIVDKFLDDSITSDSGRGYLQETLINVMDNDSGMLGHGLFSSWYYIQTYPHILFLDIFFSFGYILGAVLLLGLAYVIYKAFRYANETNKLFLILLMCASLVKLMMSGTFVQDPMLYMLIGFSISISKRRIPIIKFSKL